MRRIMFLLIVLCLIGPKTAFPAKHHSSGKLAVKAALVADYGTGKIFYSQDPDRRIAPASVTKVMTMYLVFDMVASGQASFSDKVKVSRRADATGGSTMNLRAGETVTLDELMRGMAVASGNDAAVAVAEHFGGVPAWVKRMNAKARQLGMTRTTFKTPNGLPAPGQLTTARDLMKLAVSYLRHYPQALRYHSTTTINHCGAVHANTNRLLGVCEGMDGIKTGFVNASGFNIIATAKRGKTRIIAVVLGGRSSQVRNRETERILDASFEGSVDSMLAKADVAPAKSSVKRAKSHHRGKKIRVADSGRHEKISAKRGASARIDGHKASVKSSRHKAAKVKKAPSKKRTHTASRSKSKHKKKAGASSRK
ncbi:Serine-type D-Ala-D-Ala carboxypeptidase [Solidesulfovibrio fructosivorans JJ]]|uniref:Serine-type D-Ala-D-Ala carboxypeptidase n=1 Tax=Solidesulfovibrio fructosivorans JJ] TaxID=596151 RepID=E1JWB9_SOLFR|nr:D-alanyl-D-alanine carboxypeptidase family protein [Solidesulfovibrio fructosivorans]EFL51216.1 Serine-type D-Ala-D-Ala carboxypeptidase [Solidesulfovibrio fructosivorans JJ]]